MGEAKRRLERGEDWTQASGYAEHREAEQLRQIRSEMWRIEDEKKNGAWRRRGIIGVETPEDKRRIW